MDKNELQKRMEQAIRLTAPGQPIRTALDMIIAGHLGALICVGDTENVLAAGNDGFPLNISFTSNRLFELSKMDGAIVIDGDLTQILRANFHLNPDPSLATSETGMRHRTAARMSVLTDAIVISVSARRAVVNVYVHGKSYEIQPVATIMSSVNQLVATLQTTRQSLDRSLLRLTALELDDYGKGMVCIYVAIGQKASTVANIRETLAQHGALDYTIIVSATAADSAPMQYIAPMAGAAIGEFFMYNGEDGKPASETNPGGHVLVIYDDLSKQAVAYRQMSLTLHRPPGREAYPGDIFYLHSRLLERAVKMSKKNGYGSMTALPIIETQDGDVSAYIPTNVISITDGQIYLQSELFFQGQRPAVDVGISVSRVGGDAQTKAMKQVAGNLRLDLASYQELAGFTQFGSDLDEATQKQLTHGARMTELLKQPRYKPFEVGEQIVTLFAGNEGFLDDLEIADVLPFRAELIEYMDNGFGSLLDKVRAKKIDDDTKAELLRVIGDFKQQFMAKHHSDVSGSEEN